MIWEMERSRRTGYFNTACKSTRNKDYGHLSPSWSLEGNVISVQENKWFGNYLGFHIRSSNPKWSTDYYRTVIITCVHEATLGSRTTYRLMLNECQHSSVRENQIIQDMCTHLSKPCYLSVAPETAAPDYQHSTVSLELQLLLIDSRSQMPKPRSLLPTVLWIIPSIRNIYSHVLNETTIYIYFVNRRYLFSRSSCEYLEEHN